MMIELPARLDALLKAQANAHGISASSYVREVLERDLAASLQAQAAGVPFITDGVARGSSRYAGPHDCSNSRLFRCARYQP